MKTPQEIRKGGLIVDLPHEGDKSPDNVIMYTEIRDDIASMHFEEFYALAQDVRSHMLARKKGR